MKIKLPKTLAEPLTIPWPKPWKDGLATYIAEELEIFFRYLEMKGITPKPLGDEYPENTTFSRGEIGRMLRGNALQNGAFTAWVAITNLHGDFGYSCDVIGYRYEVNFAVSGGSHVIQVTLESHSK
jgi:hypothetical protein